MYIGANWKVRGKSGVRKVLGRPRKVGEKSGHPCGFIMVSNKCEVGRCDRGTEGTHHLSPPPLLLKHPVTLWAAKCFASPSVLCLVYLTAHEPLWEDFESVISRFPPVSTFLLWTYVDICHKSFSRCFLKVAGTIQTIGSECLPTENPLTILFGGIQRY